MSKRTIYLADLTHRGLVLSSNIFPLSIGLIAAYLLERRTIDATVDLFKYPEDFSAALENKQPDIVGFANYSWNLNLSYGYIQTIKALWPNVVIVSGGPNYGLEKEEIEEFWSRYPLIDFYIVKEGEAAFANLVAELDTVNMNAASLKATKKELPNCHYVADGAVVTGPLLPRLEIADLPSPYLAGLMDKFFDENLIPMIHTTRGCPFQCAFCTEGNAYYNTVSQRLDDLRDELHYIAKRVRGPRDILLSDANFGMYKQDYEKARLLAECQALYQFPRNIVVSTGKNQKERVIEISQMLNGALSLAASLQSTDPTVLENVSRSNISLDKLAEIGLLANKVDTGTYSELILGLPGDTVSAHKTSLRDTVDANFDNIRMYQLIMLPQTRLNTPENRQRFGMRTKHRIMPRSFGRYEVAGHRFVAVESEDILIEHDTMSFDDYISCRELDLTVELLHNGKVYEELQGFCKIIGHHWFDFILLFFERRRNFSPELTQLYDVFRDDGTSRLWNSRDDLEKEVEKNIDALLKNERGTNEMSVSKSTAFFQLFEQINTILFELMRTYSDNMGNGELYRRYLTEMERFSFLRKSNLLDYDIEYNNEFSFDMVALEKSKFTLPPGEVALDTPRMYSIAHSSDHKIQLESLKKEFGRTPDSLGKMLMRFPHVHRVFRHVQEAHYN